MKLVIGCNSETGIMLITKLLHRCPLAVYYGSDPNNVLRDFCNIHQLPTHKVTSNEDFPTEIAADLLINISGLPFLVSQENIRRFNYGIVNLHTGIIEKYRGRWMVSWSIINDESHVGYTWHFMDNRFDTGNILFQRQFPICSTDTAYTLHQMLISDAICNVDQVVALSSTTGTKQVNIGRYYNKDKPFDGVIQPDWTDSQIDRFIRAMYYPPHTPAIYIKNNVQYQANTFDEFKQLR